MLSPIHAVLAGLAVLALVVAIVTGLAVERLCELVRLLREQRDDDRNHFDDECRGLASRLSRIDGEQTHRSLYERLY